MESVCVAAKVSVHTAGWVVALLVLSSAVTRTAAAGRHWAGRRVDDDDDATTATATATVAATATTATVRGHFAKVMREEMETDDAVVDVGLVGESKRRSPGGPDPQHH